MERKIHVTRYCVGFLIDPVTRRVLLIRKTKPAWQAGKWNGIGGKIEATDKSDVAAMHRECLEKTGLDISPWTSVCVLEALGNSPDSTDYCELSVFCAFVSVAILKQAKNTEGHGEHLEIIRIDFLHRLALASSNILWLVPMAMARADAPWYDYKVREVKVDGKFVHAI